VATPSFAWLVAAFAFFSMAGPVPTAMAAPPAVKPEFPPMAQPPNLFFA